MTVRAAVTAVAYVTCAVYAVWLIVAAITEFNTPTNRKHTP